LIELGAFWDEIQHQQSIQCEENCYLPGNSPSFMICFLSQCGLPRFTTRKSLFRVGSRSSNFASAAFANGFSELPKAFDRGQILKIPNILSNILQSCLI
jgi:hypothetical protein